MRPDERGGGLPRPPLRPGEIPPERWIIERPFDSADYLEGPPPNYPDDPGYVGPDGVREIELACPGCGHCWWVDCRPGARGTWLPEAADDSICPACLGPEGEA